MIIGITGSIGSGKTTAAKMFGAHCYNRIDADKIAHEIIKKNSAAYKKIIKAFGAGILDKNKDVERKRLGDAVFGDDRKLKTLNSIMHPIIIESIKNEISKIKNKCQGKTRIVIDAPLLLETDTKNLVDKIIIVKCDEKNAVKRLNKKYPKEKIEKILKSQMPLDEKLKYADSVVDNNKDLQNLRNRVREIVEELN